MALWYDPDTENGARAVAPIIFDRRCKADVPASLTGSRHWSSVEVTTAEPSLAPLIAFDVQRDNPFAGYAILDRSNQSGFVAWLCMADEAWQRLVDATPGDRRSDREILEKIESCAEQVPVLQQKIVLNVYADFRRKRAVPMSLLEWSEIVLLARGNDEVHDDRNRRHSVFGSEMADAELREQLEIANRDFAVISAGTDGEERLNPHRVIAQKSVLVEAAGPGVMVAARYDIKKIGLRIEVALRQGFGR